MLLSCSAGNDSVAMIQMAHELRLDILMGGISVIYIDTGWAASWWEGRVNEIKALCENYSFSFDRIREGHTFESLMLSRKGFPMPGKTWCSYELKGRVFNEYCERIDPDGEAFVAIGKRRDESHARRDTPEWVLGSDRHGDRVVWRLLAYVVKNERDALIRRSGLQVLPHRSQECSPCINANRADLLALGEYEIERTARLEREVGKNMFRPWHHMGANGFVEVMRWAHSPRGKYEPEHEGCGSGLCE